MAGLPVYPSRGRNGGWRLAGGGRTDLTGLTAAEARALFLVAGPASSATPEVKAALRKLVRALPEPFRSTAEAAATSVVVDPGDWDQAPRRRSSPPLLEAVQTAVVEARQITLGYVARQGEPSSRLVEPLGLAAKGDAWYLVGDTDKGLRTFRVDRMTSVDTTGRPATRPEGFDLAEAWKLISDEVDRKRAPVAAEALAAPHAVAFLRMTLGTRLQVGAPVDDGRESVVLRGHNTRSLAAELAGFGNWLEVLSPEELRVGLAAVAAELTALYSGPA